MKELKNQVLTKDIKPASMGYAMPAEWEQHAGTLLSWPANRETWPGERLEKVEKVYVEIIRALSSCEPVHLIVSGMDTEVRAKTILAKELAASAPVFFHTISGNDVWARDFGPIFIKRIVSGKEEYAITDWEYNAWGGKYPPYKDDNDVPDWISKKFGIKSFKTDMVLEGGSIETNGNGVILTTKSVLLNPNRNPRMTQAEIEQKLRDYLGHEKIIWLNKGLAGDDTDGHIDDLSRFLNKTTILTMVEENPSDPNYQALSENYELLKRATDTNGKPFDIVTLPMPKTKIEDTTVDGSEYVPASYANFYFANNAVLLPVYDPRYDDKAIQLFKKYCPDRKVIPIPCADLVWGQGSIHCITQQLYGV